MSEDRYTEDPRADQAQADDVYENDDERGGFLSPTGWPSFPRTGAAEEAPDERPDERETTGEGDENPWAERAITLLLVGGLVLFFFPEPATSAAGIVLMSVGVVLWAADRFR